MNTKLSRATVVVLASLTVFLCCLSVAEAYTTSLIDVEAPEEVGIGQPFLVKVSSPYILDDLSVSWEGREVTPAAVETGGGYSALVILGVNLKRESGVGVLKVSANLWGHSRRVEKHLEIVPVAYPKETLSVPPKMVKPPQETLNRIARERKLIRQTLETSSSVQQWDMPFTRPVKGKILSRFGLHRTFNGDTKRRHTGLDFRAWEGTPLHSMAGGTVLVVDHLYFAGNCAFIDHGNGLISLYWHMSKVLVKAGDTLEPGQVVGLSGATGRVTGAHLHLAIFAQGMSIDPEPFFNGTLAIDGDK